jgi:hypothetical protein
MSWQIPTQIEQDIIAGKAQYRTFQTGNGGQSVLPVPPNSYVVIFGYDFSPAGGGLKMLSQIDSANFGSIPILNNSIIRFFETQQISFYTGTDFFPFIHHLDVKTTQSVLSTTNPVPPSNIITINLNILEELDSTPIARQVYITSSNAVTITHGLVLQMNDEVLGPIQEAIPVTNTTPLGLTYGGSGQVINIQTQYSAAGFSPIFTQPQVENYEKYSFVAPLPANADNQVYATPDTTNGLRDASEFLNSLGAEFNQAAATQYYLCLHYALYTASVPEQRG